MIKNLPANAGNVGSISASGRSPGVGNGNPLQYSCLENLMDRGAWRGHSPRGHKESDTHTIILKQTNSWKIRSNLQLPKAGVGGRKNWMKVVDCPLPALQRHS